MSQSGRAEQQQQQQLRKKSSGGLSISATWVLVLFVAVGALLFSSSVFPSFLEKASTRIMVGGKLGGSKPVQGAENSAEIEEMAKYAVSEHNSKQGTNLKFKKVQKASVQVVAGTMYHLTVEATPESSDESKVFEAKVWTKPWLSHKSLEHFKEVETSSS